MEKNISLTNFKERKTVDTYSTSSSSTLSTVSFCWRVKQSISLHCLWRVFWRTPASLSSHWVQIACFSEGNLFSSSYFTSVPFTAFVCMTSSWYMRKIFIKSVIWLRCCSIRCFPAPDRKPWKNNWEALVII